jgi:hypothetical protein
VQDDREDHGVIRAGTALLVLLAVAFAAPAFGAEPPEKPDEQAAFVPPEFAARKAEAEEARALTFTKPLTAKPLTRDEVAPFIEKKVREAYAPGELEALLLAYEKLGLVKSAEGLPELLVRAYASQLVALYDHKTHTIHLIEDLPVPKVMQQIAQVHELVHALQDQHFDLSALPLEEPHNSDRSTAAMALVEGDATLATLAYATEHARMSVADSLRVALFAAQPAPTAPYLFQREMKFIYFDGLSFARALHDKGGWEALNAAFGDPPASTEQVLHFREKYLEARDEPTPVEIPDCCAVLGADWTLAADDVLGELYTQVLFRQHLSFARAAKPSRGWDGDRLHLYRAAEGAATILVWRSVWDTDKDAAEFAAAYRTVLARKLGTDKATPEEGGLGLLVSGEHAVALVHVEGPHALIVEAPSATLAREVARYVLTPGNAETTPSAQ